MNSEQVTRAELLEALRWEGYSSLTNVRFAFLETDGSITLGGRKSEQLELGLLSRWEHLVGRDCSRLGGIVPTIAVWTTCDCASLALISAVSTSLVRNA